MQQSIAVLRHSARGCLNAVKLCVSALELECTSDEQIEFLDDVIRSSDQLSAVVVELAAAFDSQGVAQSNQV